MTEVLAELLQSIDQREQLHRQENKERNKVEEKCVLLEEKYSILTAEHSLVKAQCLFLEQKYSSLEMKMQQLIESSTLCNNNIQRKLNGFIWKRLNFAVIKSELESA